jgi:hypothetical protein
MHNRHKLVLEGGPQQLKVELYATGYMGDELIGTATVGDAQLRQRRPDGHTPTAGTDEITILLHTMH